MFQKLREWALVVLCLAATAAILPVGYEATMFLCEARKSALPAMAGAFTDVSREAEIAGGLTNELRDQLKGIRADEDQVAANSTKATSQLNADLADADALIVQTKATVAGIGSDASDVDAQARESLQILNAQTAQLGSAIAGLRVSEDAATADFSDPDVKISLASLATSSQNIAAASDQANAVLSDVHRVTTYEAKQITAPVSTVKRVLGFFAWLAGRFY